MAEIELKDSKNRAFDDPCLQKPYDDISSNTYHEQPHYYEEDQDIDPDGPPPAYSC